MNNIQSFTTPKGEAMVILSKKDYDRLVSLCHETEDDDLRDARRVLKRVKENKEPLTPLPVYKLMRESDMSRVRAWRTWRGLSSAALARKTGKSLSYLVQIENGTRKGTLATMSLLAKALGTTVDALKD